MPFALWIQTALVTSTGAQRVFGYEPEEMIGRSMFDSMHPAHHAETLLRAEQVIMDGRATF